MSFNVSYLLELKDRYSANAKKINARTRTLNTSLNNLNKRLATSRAEFAGAGTRMASFATGMLATIAAAAGAGALISFERNMAKVKAISGATGEQFSELRKQARLLGQTTEFTSAQAAAGQAFLAQAGFKTNEILAAMPDILDLATAGTLGLAEAADIASNIMTPFGIAASESARVVDSLAIIAANSNTNIQQLGNAMKNVAPVAAKLKIPLEATAAAIGVLGDSGIQAERAGTGLKIVLQRLVKPVGEVKLAFAALAVRGQELNPAVNTMSDVLSRLNAKLDKIKDPAKRAAIEIAIFGSEASAVGSVLLKSTGRIDELTKKMIESKGAGKEMASIMRDNLGGDIDSLLSSVSGLVIGIGEGGLTGGLRDIIQTMTGAFRAVSSFSATFPALTSFMVKATAAIIAIKLATMVYGKGMIAFLAIQKAVTVGVLLFNAAMMANPLGLLIGGMALAIGAFIAFRSEIGATIDSFLGLFNLSLPSWMRSAFGMGEVNINAGDKGIAAQGSAASGRLDGNININAPAGVIRSVDSVSTGTGVNLGLNMAGNLG